MCFPIRSAIAGGVLAATLLAAAALPAEAQLQDQTRVAPTNDRPNPYARVHPWGELPNPYVPGAYDERTSFIGADEGPDGNIYLLSGAVKLTRGERDDPGTAQFPSSFSRQTSPHPRRETSAFGATGGEQLEAGDDPRGRD